MYCCRDSQDDHSHFSYLSIITSATIRIIWYHSRCDYYTVTVVVVAAAVVAVVSRIVVSHVIRVNIIMIIIIVSSISTILTPTMF